MKLKTQKAKGTKDIFGNEANFYLKIRELVTNFSLLNGFNYIETPIIENARTFSLSLGNTSQVITKEMFYLKGKEKGESFVLRPEGTASIVRAYFDNGMNSWQQPVSLFYFGKMYRKERPQHGRLREHTQWGLEILNTNDIFADFFVIYAFAKFFKKININDFLIKMNSLGCSTCRPRYLKHLVGYYKKIKKNICSDCQKRLVKNPLRILDCKNNICQEYKQGTPNILDHLCKNCRFHFEKVLELVDYFKLNYELDKTLVRGFDYYQGTVFEFFSPKESFAFCSGGRYDLGGTISKMSLPSVGGAVGIERLKMICDQENISFRQPKNKIFIAFAGEEVRAKAFEIYEKLQNFNFRPVALFFKTSLSHQLEYANKIGVKYSLILGFQELGKEMIILKDMKYGIQESLKIKNLLSELKVILKEQND